MSKVKIASYNLENLFTRPSAMNTADDGDGRQALEDHAELNAIIAHPEYSIDDKQRLIALSNRYGFHQLNPPQDALVFLQKTRGQLFRTSAGQLRVAASGRGDWAGWFELRRESVAWEATSNTGRVIQAQEPDVLVAVEVEDRPTLKRFNEQILGAQFGVAFAQELLFDGNDQRGIDVGLLSRFPVSDLRTHVFDQRDGRTIFSRDCPEYQVDLPGDRRLIVLPNHFKSKRNGNAQASQNRRRVQAEEVALIATDALKRTPLVLIAGDLNDTPDSWPLEPLFEAGFVDVGVHPNYLDPELPDRPGTFGTGLPGDKIDYLLMSPTLLEALTDAGIERRGSFHPNTWKPFDSVTGPASEASDHHLIWGVFDL